MKDWTIPRPTKKEPEKYDMPGRAFKSLLINYIASAGPLLDKEELNLLKDIFKLPEYKDVIHGAAVQLLDTYPTLALELVGDICEPSYNGLSGTVGHFCDLEAHHFLSDTYSRGLS